VRKSQEELSCPQLPWRLSSSLLAKSPSLTCQPSLSNQVLEPVLHFTPIPLPSDLSTKSHPNTWLVKSLAGSQQLRWFSPVGLPHYGPTPCYTLLLHCWLQREAGPSLLCLHPSCYGMDIPIKANLLKAWSQCCVWWWGTWEGTRS
jgi:hypothetical protein